MGLAFGIFFLGCNLNIFEHCSCAVSLWRVNRNKCFKRCCFARLFLTSGRCYQKSPMECGPSRQGVLQPGPPATSGSSNFFQYCTGNNLQTRVIFSLFLCSSWHTTFSRELNHWPRMKFFLYLLWLWAISPFITDFPGNQLSVKQQIMTLDVPMLMFKWSTIVFRVDNRKIFIPRFRDRTCYGQQYLWLLLATNVIPVPVYICEESSAHWLNTFKYEVSQTPHLCTTNEWKALREVGSPLKVGSRLRCWMWL